MKTGQQRHKESSARVKTCTRDHIIRIRNLITTDLCHGVAVCSGLLPPVCSSGSRFESKWRSPRHLHLRFRSKPPRKRSCLPQQVALRASWTFLRKSQTTQQAVTLAEELIFTIHLTEGYSVPSTIELELSTESLTGHPAALTLDRMSP